jgi:gamma-glutamyltranspeptidase/glutathione hydrolase
METVVKRGGVASGHPRVTEAASELLHAGGNAFDAVVGAGFASAVVEPALTSLGGGGFLLARTAQGRSTLFDFFVDTPGQGLGTTDLEPHFLPVTVRFPASDQIFNVGLGSVAVPGNLRGLLYVHRRLGCLPLAEVIAPAVQLARGGQPLNALQAYILSLLYPIMTLTPAGRTLFEPNGRYLQEGDQLANPELADFMETLLRDGEREFYEGEIARRIVQDMRAGQGLLTEVDLAAYQVIEREPLSVDYRGFRLLTNPPPAFGGSLIALSLRLLEAHEAGVLPFGSPAHLLLLAAVMEEVDRCRAEGLLGPADLSATALATRLARLRTASGGTTHVSVCDAASNVASMTTSNGEGSGYLIPGTGIMLNNMMGEDDLHPDGFHASPPGIRVASMMSPSLLLEGERVRLVLGSGGSKRIRTALMQVISHVIDFGLPLQAAVEAPRLHWDGAYLQVEPGYTETALKALRQRWPVNSWPVRNIYFGGVHAVSPQGESAGDPRRGGSAVVLG